MVVCCVCAYVSVEFLRSIRFLSRPRFFVGVRGVGVQRTRVPAHGGAARRRRRRARAPCGCSCMGVCESVSCDVDTMSSNLTDLGMSLSFSASIPLRIE